MGNNIISTGLAGLQAGLARAAKEAENLSKITTFDGTNPNSDPVDSIVAMKTSLQQAKASAKVIKVGKDLDDTVLNILA